MSIYRTVFAVFLKDRRRAAIFSNYSWNPETLQVANYESGQPKLEASLCLKNSGSRVAGLGAWEQEEEEIRKETSANGAVNLRQA